MNSAANSLTATSRRLGGGRARSRTWMGRALRDLAYCGAIVVGSFVAGAVLLTGLALTVSLIFVGIGVVVWIALVLAARLITAVDRSLAGWQRG